MLSGSVSGTADPAAGYQQGKQSATRSVDEAKIRVWEEFGEATWNKTFRVEAILANRQATQRCSTHCVGVLLTLTEDTVGRS